MKPCLDVNNTEINVGSIVNVTLESDQKTTILKNAIVVGLPGAWPHLELYHDGGVLSLKTSEDTNYYRVNNVTVEYFNFEDVVGLSDLIPVLFSDSDHRERLAKVIRAAVSGR